MIATLSLPLTPSERTALELIDQGHEVSKAMLDVACRNGWIAHRKGKPGLTDAGRAALRKDVFVRGAHRRGLRGGRR
jgi:hypothetical protein